MIMLGLRQIAAVLGVSVLGFGASFALARSGDGHRAGAPETVVRPATLSVARSIAAGAMPAAGSVPDLVMPRPVSPVRGGGEASTPSTPTPPPRPVSSAPVPQQGTGAVSKTGMAPKTDPSAPRTTYSPQPTPSQAASPSPQQPTVTTIIGG